VPHSVRNKTAGSESRSCARRLMIVTLHRGGKMQQTIFQSQSISLERRMPKCLTLTQRIASPVAKTAFTFRVTVNPTSQTEMIRIRFTDFLVIEQGVGDVFLAECFRNPPIHSIAARAELLLCQPASGTAVLFDNQITNFQASLLRCKMIPSGGMGA